MSKRVVVAEGELLFKQDAFAAIYGVGHIVQVWDDNLNMHELAELTGKQVRVIVEEVSEIDDNLKDVVAVWEQEGFGLISQRDGERLQELIDNYPVEQVKAAIAKAAANGKRKIAYVAGILRNDSVDGSRKGKDGKQRVQKSERFPEQYRSPDELRQTLQ